MARREVERGCQGWRCTSMVGWWEGDGIGERVGAASWRRGGKLWHESGEEEGGREGGREDGIMVQLRQKSPWQLGTIGLRILPQWYTHAGSCLNGLHYLDHIFREYVCWNTISSYFIQHGNLQYTWSFPLYNINVYVLYLVRSITLWEHNPWAALTLHPSQLTRPRVSGVSVRGKEGEGPPLLFESAIWSQRRSKEKTWTFNTWSEEKKPPGVRDLREEERALYIHLVSITTQLTLINIPMFSTVNMSWDRDPSISFTGSN